MPFHMLPVIVIGAMGLTEPLGAHVGLEGVDVGVVGGHVRVGRLSRFTETFQSSRLSYWGSTRGCGTSIGRMDVFHSAMCLERSSVAVAQIKSAQKHPQYI